MAQEEAQSRCVNHTAISLEDFDAVLFDMDGVVTRTAAAHFSAWKTIFDAFLKHRNGARFEGFTQRDYLDYVDGKPREDGVRSFLSARAIELEEGGAGDPPGFGTISALAKKKDDEFQRLIHTKGVEAYETTLSLIRDLREAGLKTALVTASRNGAEILRVTNTGHLFDVAVTGVETAELHLRGKPAADVFLEAARRLAVIPARAIVVEDAEAGVEAGKNGHFGMVIGVARQGNTTSLLDHGADVVVRDLAEVSVPKQADSEIRGMAMADLDVTEANWIVSYDNYDPEHEQRRESLCALGNGKFCTRGAAPESRADDVHYPGTYVAGGYNTIKLEGEGPFEREEVVNMPNWLCLSFKIGDDDWFSIDKARVTQYSQKLNLREGILYRRVEFLDEHGRQTQLSERRFVHMRYSQLAGIELIITAINWSGRITVRTAIDGGVVNSNEPIDPKFASNKHLRTLEKDAHDDAIFLKVITTNSKLIVAEAARTQFFVEGAQVDLPRRAINEEECVAQEVTLDLKQSKSIRICKTCALFTSRDRGISEPGLAAREAIMSAPQFDQLCSAQIKVWRSLWRQFDLFIETTEECSKLVPSLLLHLNSFHCLQSASIHTVDLDSAVPARGWTGEGYQGHIFWDDLFIFPFVNLRMPDISAALLKYRYRRLDEARKIAQSYGASGACFPWRSASDGKERTPEYWWMPESQQWIRDYTHLEIHVNGSIAYNVWQYYQVAADNHFMYLYGAEILLEIARFFATYAVFNPERDRYEIHGVIGPDEFHNGYPNFETPGVKNNAYTNILAVWTLSRALELFEVLPSDHRQYLRNRLDISDSEIKLWRDITSKMFVPIMSNGVVAQFEGYEELEDFPGFADGKIDHDKLEHLLRENLGYLNQYKISKQADALMLGFLFSQTELTELIRKLGYSEESISIERMAEYYMPRTANYSTLSRVAHVWVLSRLSRLTTGERSDRRIFSERQEDEIFYEALGSDYFDVAARGTARTGIHMAAMAGTVDIVQRCYTGIVTRNDVLWLDPIMPKPLVRLSFTLQYRGQSLAFDVHHDKMQVRARHSSASAIKVGYGKEVYELNAGDTKIISLQIRS